MTWSRRGVLGAGAALALAGCHKASGGRLAVAEASKTGIKAMLTVAGAIDHLDYQIEWVEFNQTPPMLTALGANAVDVASGGDTGLVFLKANTPDLTMKAVLAQRIGDTNPDNQGCAVLVKGGSPLHGLEDLRGKTIALTQGTVVHYQLIEWLRRKHVAFTDIHVVNLQPDQALSALQTGQVDAWASYEPYASVAEIEFGARRLPGTDLLPVYGLVLASDAALADPAREPLIRDFLGRLVRAQRWLGDHRDTWTGMARQATGLPDAIARRSAPRSLATPLAITPEVIANVQAQADTFARIGLIKHPVTMADAFDSRFSDVLGHG